MATPSRARSYVPPSPVELARRSSRPPRATPLAAISLRRIATRRAPARAEPKPAVVVLGCIWLLG